MKSSFAEAQPVINHSLNLIVSAVSGKENEHNNDINTLVVCIRKIMMADSQNVPLLHHICSFLIKYHTVRNIFTLINQYSSIISEGRWIPLFPCFPCLEQ